MQPFFTSLFFSQHIFHECILGALQSKTRILVTHQVHLLHLCDLIIVLDQGAIKAIGTYEDLENSGKIKYQEFYSTCAFVI